MLVTVAVRSGEMCDRRQPETRHNSASIFPLVAELRHCSLQSIGTLGRNPNCIPRQHWAVFAFRADVRALRNVLGPLRLSRSLKADTSNTANAVFPGLANWCDGLPNLTIGMAGTRHRNDAWRWTICNTSTIVLFDFLRTSLCWIIGPAILSTTLEAVRRSKAAKEEIG